MAPGCGRATRSARSATPATPPAATFISRNGPRLATTRAGTRRETSPTPSRSGTSTRRLAGAGSPLLLLGRRGQDRSAVTGLALDMRGPDTVREAGGSLLPSHVKLPLSRDGCPLGGS